MSRDTNFYYSFLVLPPRKRRAIVAVWDFCRAVDDAVDEVVPEPEWRGGLSDEARARAAGQLREWRQELRRCYDGEAPLTPQGRTLAPFVSEFRLPRDAFEDLIDGVEMDLRCSRYQTFDALSEYCRRVASAVGLICLEIFGYTDARARDYAAHLGMALQLTNIIRDVGPDLRRGRIYLPVEDMARFGCTEQVLQAGQMTPAIRALLEFQATRAAASYRRADETLPRADVSRLVAAEIMGGIYREILHRVERAGFDVFQRRIRVPRPTRALIAAQCLGSLDAQSMTAADVVVIGGGFAGLSAATALADRGRRVLVLESRPRTGGRATAFTDPTTGERVDNGQHVLFGCYRETLRFLRRIGAEEHVAFQASLEVEMIGLDGQRSRLVCPALPPPLHLVAAIFDWDALGWADRFAVLRLRAPLAQARKQRRGAATAAASPGETVRQWLQRNGQTPRIVEMLWDPLAVAALNQSIDQAAAPTFARVLADMFGNDPFDAAIALPTLPLYEAYAAPAEAFVASRGGGVRTDAHARLEMGDDGSVRVRLRDDVVNAPVVIVAVPWFELPELFRGVPPLSEIAAAAADTDAMPIVTVNLWYDRVILDRPFLGFPGRLMQWAFEKPSTMPGAAVRLSLVSSGATAVAGWPHQQLIDNAVEEVAAAVPAARTASLLRATVVKEKRATFSLAPGQPPRPSTRTDVPGLLLAGDWIDTGLPATIEGAVVSGHMAADVALQIL